MSARWRKAARLAHVTASVGWLGTVVAFLALAVTGLSTPDTELARAVFVVMAPLGWFAVVPFSVASLVTGLVSSLGTSWGLLRRYWVLAKLVINVVATIILLLYMQTLGGSPSWPGGPGGGARPVAGRAYDGRDRPPAPGDDPGRVQAARPHAVRAPDDPGGLRSGFVRRRRTG